MKINSGGADREPSDKELEQMLDAPRSADGALGMFFEALSAPITGDLMPGEIAAMSEYRATRPLAAPQAAGRGGRLKAWVAAFSISGGVLVAGGVAAAATGNFHQVVHDVFGVGHAHSHSTGATAAPTTGASTGVNPDGTITLPDGTTVPAPELTSTPPVGGGKSTAPGQGGTTPGVGTGKGQGATHGNGIGVGNTPPGHLSPKPTHSPKSTHSPNPNATKSPGQGGTHRNTPTPKPKKSHTPNPNSTKSPGQGINLGNVPLPKASHTAHSTGS